MSTIPEITKDARAAMDRAIENSKREFSTIRSGKASAALLDTVRVEAYGQTMPLSQVASVAAPEPRSLTVTPWDKGVAAAIEKAIRDSDLGLNPANQGGMIRVPIPALNEERRRELVKIIHKLAEEGRIAIRHARTEARERVKRLEKVSEDEKKHADKELQKLHDDHVARLDALLQTKEGEIMEV
ncbi:MAG TPA: ribosome recycling factor [Gemmatimonadaceae bacterium]|nr:ribosome recycling factor [Gemmatimonadaceae bacterium]